MPALFWWIAGSAVAVSIGLTALDRWYDRRDLRRMKAAALLRVSEREDD